MSKLLPQLKSRLARLRERVCALGLRRGVLVLLAVLVLMGLMVFAHQVKSHTASQSKVATPEALPPVNQTAVLTASLNAIQATLAQVQQRLSQPATPALNASIKTTLAGVTASLSHLQASNQQHYQALSQQVGKLASTVASNQHATVKQLTTLEKLNSHQTCLSADHLPFTVRSIDWINGQAVVSVQYNHSVVPLEQHFSLAGWQLKHSDYEQQTAQFTNTQGVCAAVQLKGGFA